MERKRIDELIGIHRDGLLKDVVPFWMKHTIDKEYGGFLNYLDHDGSVYSTDKPVWPLGRLIWLLSTLHSAVEQRQEWLEAAKHGIDFMEKHCFDTDGRMFYEVTRDGRPLRKRRYTWTEMFGVFALSAYAVAAKDSARMEMARTLFKRVVCLYQNPELLPPKGYPQTRPTRQMLGIPMILLPLSQQMRRIDQDPLYDQIAQDMLRDVDYHIHPEIKAVLEIVGPKGERLDIPDGRVVNPGHSLELAEFLFDEYGYRKDQTLLEKALQIVDWSVDWGWDKKYGGLLYFVDIEGKPSLAYEHDMKLWWPHNEGAYACLQAHYYTGDDKYAQWYEKIHDWAFSHFPDKKHGGWYKYLHRDGSVSSTIKGNRWASPWHVPRMHYLCWKLLEKMKKEA